MKITTPGNEINYLLQQTRVHHMHLSSMADLKANMLLTMASIVVTLAAPQVMKAGSQLPLLVLIGFSLMTILLAAYAVMPKLPFTGRQAAAPEVHSPQFNLLFFGDFTGLSYAQFEAEMTRVMGPPRWSIRRSCGRSTPSGSSSRRKNTATCGWPTRRSSSACSRASPRCC